MVRRLFLFHKDRTAQNGDEDTILRYFLPKRFWNLRVRIRIYRVGIGIYTVRNLVFIVEIEFLCQMRRQKHINKFEIKNLIIVFLFVFNFFQFFVFDFCIF